MPLSSTRRAFLAAAGVGLVGGCLGNDGEATTLTMGVIPDVDPDTAIAKNTELADYLESELDATVDLQTTTDYAGLVQAMSAGQVDLGYFGGVSYILAHHRADATPVVVGSKDGSTDWHSVFVAHESTGVTDMADLKSEAGDLELVFGDPLSTSGTVMPTYYLRRHHDVDPETSFESVTHVGAHDAVMEAVAGGNSDVGALNARIYDSLVDQRDSAENLTEVWRTPGFPDYPWAVGSSLDDGTVSGITDAFTSLHEKGKEAVLARQNVDEYVEVGHDDFQELHDAVEMAGLLNEENA